ncbi:MULTISPECIES: hypothetical protein [Glutamicibacter]|uniref:Uncharacterized protein n=1 Tax=Glutamicibacter halophytocola TaxID=1933880 RepID=A0A5B8IPM0_9MICC|nr:MULTISPECIES: hypothetical protein [Glutamicibacter]ALG30025.1 hypothetical protein AOZ07_14265 [Glutamicibacter halophytocola]MBF6670808.1 hypothetical protein [Glutamicibacter sp. FBE19]NQD40745.1 hypothetical protein [Glutamicibacter halophytocola]QDY66298.1 hypothetical protein FQA45_08190 [Glutamicibacter halophytocola]UUX58395.1 hypothetical protein NUH22_14005 [Glutamicibacter halophytocola]
MRFVLEVNFDTENMQLKPMEELQRILSDWSQRVAMYPLEPGAQEDVYDSQNEEVGEWAILGD